MITQGGEHGYNIYNCTGTVQSRHRQRPLSGLCLVTSSVSYQGVIFVLHSRLTLSYRPRVLTTVVLKVRSRATQRCPREVLRRDDREGTTSVPVCLAPDRWPRELPNHGSRAPPGAHARQGKETVHLVGNRSDLVGRRDRHRCTGGPGCCRCPRVS